MNLKKIKKRILILIVLLLITITRLTYSRLFSFGSIDINSNLALWSVKINGTLVSSDYSFSLNNIVWSDTTKVANGYVAPGGDGYYEVEIDTSGTQVAVDYSFGFDASFLEEFTRLRITKVTVDDVIVTGDNGYYDGFIPLSDVLSNKKVKVKIYVVWNEGTNETDNELDTDNALSYGNIELPIVVNVRQHIDEADTNNLLVTQLIPYKESLLEVSRPDSLIINPYYTAPLDALYENPERGLYNANFLNLSKTGNVTKDIESKVSKLIYLKVDLSAFSAWRNGTDIELTLNAINTLKEQLEIIKQHNNTVILRFVYDNGATGIHGGGSTKFEPNQTMLLRHIEQLKDVFIEYDTTIYTIQVGFYGLWGESFYNTDVNSHPEYYKQTMEALLEATNGTEIMIAFRTPSYLKSAITGSSYDTKRVGMFNDAYLSQNDDMGTYTNRNEEIEWLSSRNTSFGGEALPATFSNTTEVIKSYGDDGTYSAVGGLNNYLNLLKTETNNWDLISYVEDEMYKTHTSYMNFEWNQYKHYIWSNQIYNGNNSLYHGMSALEFVQNHLGYRLVLKKIELPRSASVGLMNASIEINNVGFGNVLKSKNATLLFVDEVGNVAGTVDITSEFDIKEFTSKNTIKKNIVFNLPTLTTGTYKVYLRVSNNEILNNGKYYSAIRFANNGVWDATLQANKIGSIKIN